MIYYITFLRAAAACLITNAHYEGIYPSSVIANGGLLGDILFFAVSGYCLCSVKKDFLPWYGKRIWRIYLPAILVTALYLHLGWYSTGYLTKAQWYIYPTGYHFLASIIVLYIPFYIIMKTEWLRTHLKAVMLAVAGVWMITYVFFYDHSVYRIDTVWEPMIRFLLMESMLLGAWFRQQDGKYRNQFRISTAVMTAASFFLYFGTKLLFSRNENLAPLQFFNQITIFILLYCILKLTAGLDAKLEAMPDPVKKTVRFIADRTLEIYVVQEAIIVQLGSVGPFPVNWLILTASILAAASVLHWICRLVNRGVDIVIKKWRASF